MTGGFGAASAASGLTSAAAAAEVRNVRRSSSMLIEFGAIFTCTDNSLRRSPEIHNAPNGSERFEQLAYMVINSMCTLTSL
jgi:hypothetical protein